MNVLAIDIGGTKLAAGIVDGGGRILRTDRVPTPQGDGVTDETIWRTLTSLIDSVRAGEAVSAVGVGCGGPMAWPEGVVSPLNMPAWRDFPLRGRLRRHLPDVPVRVHNDASCLAVAEHWRGAGRGRDNVLGMVVSTGVGGGLVLGGRLIGGRSGNAGHIGHMLVATDEAECGCGARGHLEGIARGPALAQWARERGWRPEDRTAGARDLADDASRGHPVALQAMRRAGRALGIAIASAVQLCDLEVVAVGGGLSQAGPLLFDPLEEAFREQARLGFAQKVTIVPVTLGQEAGLIGAAALVVAGDRYWNAD